MTSIRDDANAPTSIDIRGTHSNAAISVGSGSGQVVIGAATPSTTTPMLEVFGPAAATDPLVQFGSGLGQAYTVKIRNSTGNSLWFVANATNNFLTGTIQGDVGMKVGASGKFFHIGGTTSVMSISQDNKIGFFQKAPVVQATGIIDADGTLADITTKFNSLLTKLEAYGLLVVA